ncbi:CPBP family intramembrane metalloprotease [Streptomyces sp. WMMC500]|uniref:CPBP family intramembrane glutamic endopeptidase n=1 Tax=Streptomyces sp. WMMC500 TaxID=3015154 RepID=UPI00248BE05E|nr:CPBP family intramembrane glutamic endopeptidase [Streptomyces sp. WMMC500]WBB62862.1 CPBP family intramembrane metalloprotease [Streptomyces sp. WMMC500]
MAAQPADPGDRPTPAGEESPGLPGMRLRVLTVFAAAVLLWLFVFYGTPLGHDYDRPTHVARAVLTAVLVVPAVVLARRLLDRRPWRGLGLPLSRTGARHFLLGAACWLLPAAAGFALCLATGWVEVTRTEPVAEAAGVWAMLVVLVFLYEALPEELVFRGYIQRNLLTALAAGWTVVIQAVLFTLFGLLVGVVDSPFRALVFLTFGALLGAFRVATGDIWAGIGFHVAYQSVAQLFVGEGAAFEVSGEGVFGLVALGGLPFYAAWTYLSRRHRDTLDWSATAP